MSIHTIENPSVKTPNLQTTSNTLIASPIKGSSRLDTPSFSTRFFDYFGLITTKISDFMPIFFFGAPQLDKISDEQLLERFGLTNLKILKNLGALSLERFEIIATCAKAKFLDQNKDSNFSKLFTAYKLEKLLSFYSFEELKNKFDLEFQNRSASEILHALGPQIFASSIGRELVDYSRFETLGKVDLKEILKLEDVEQEFYEFSKNEVHYKFDSKKEIGTRSKDLFIKWC